MKLGKTLYVKNRKAWRAWLAKHHDKDKEIWLVFYKAHTGKPRVPYNDGVEEALCYGWIDSIVKRIDDECFNPPQGVGHPADQTRQDDAIWPGEVRREHDGRTWREPVPTRHGGQASGAPDTPRSEAPGESD
jgi:hypothetical protein